MNIYLLNLVFPKMMYNISIAEKRVLSKEKQFLEVLKYSMHETTRSCPYIVPAPHPLLVQRPSKYLVLEAFASQGQILILAIIKASDLKMLPKYNVTIHSVRRLSLSDNLSASNQVNVFLLSIYLGFPRKAMTQSLYSLSSLGDSHLKTHVIVRKISFAPNPGDSAVSNVPPQ